MKALAKLFGSAVTFFGVFAFCTGGVGAGVVLMIVGILILVAAFAERQRDCPFCAEKVKLRARVCRHCHRDLAQTLRATA